MTPVVRRVETRNLSLASGVLMKYSRQAPAEYVARTAAFCVKGAKDRTPYVEMSTIDSEMQVETVPRLNARTGKPVSKRTKNPNIINVTEGGVATKIILARLQPGSHYNVWTDHRYLIDRASFSPGGGEAGFWANVEERAQRMVKGKHSSTHFFEQTWNSVLKALAPMVPARYRGAVMTWAGRGKTALELGDAKFTGSGNSVELTVEDRVGMDDEWPTINARRNEAAHRVLTPALQASVNANFESAMQEMGRRGLLDKAPELMGLGMTVT